VQRAEAVTCLVKHQGDCCGCSDHPTEPMGSDAWLDHISESHGVNNLMRYNT
jgi:hypothetical protein